MADRTVAIDHDVDRIGRTTQLGRCAKPTVAIGQVEADRKGHVGIGYEFLDIGRAEIADAHSIDADHLHAAIFVTLPDKGFYIRKLLTTGVSKHREVRQDLNFAQLLIGSPFAAVEQCYRDLWHFIADLQGRSVAE